MTERTTSPDVPELERFLVRVRPYVRDQAVRRVVLDRLFNVHEASSDFRAKVHDTLTWAGVRIVEDEEPKRTLADFWVADDAAGVAPPAEASATLVDRGDKVDRTARLPPQEMPEPKRAIAAAKLLLANRRAGTTARHRVLTAQEEVGLAILIRDRRLPLEQDLPRGWRHGLRPRSDAVCAFDALIEHNMRLVWSIARAYVGQGLDYEDVSSHGMIGLLRAVDKFDATMGYKFSTYATWWIRQSITRALADEGAMIRLPVHMVEKINKVRRAYRELSSTREHVSLDDLAEMTGYEPDEVVRFLRLQAGVLSLDASLDANDDFSLRDLVSDDFDVEWTVERTLRREALDEALTTLTTREAAVLTLRFGLLDGEQFTLDEIGQQYGLTRERIRQIEAKALEKMRYPGRSAKLRAYC